MIGSAVFAHLTAEYLYFTMGRSFPPQNCPSHAGSGPYLMHDSLDPPAPQVKRHLDRFSCFCRAHNRDRADRPTDRLCYSVCIVSDI